MNQSEIYVQFPYQKSAAFRYLAFGIFIFLIGAFLWVYGGELSALQIPQSFVLTVVAVDTIVGAAFVVRALMRLFSDEPAVEITQDEVSLYTHPFHKVTLAREDIAAVNQIEHIGPSGQSFFYGSKMFSLSRNSHRRTIVPFIGQRSVDIPLPQVREAIELFTKR